MTAQTQLIVAPACAPWCNEEHAVHGWDELGRNTTKRCLMNLKAGEDVDGTAVDVEITRFADIEDGVIWVHDVDIEVGCNGKLTPEGARQVAASLVEAADLVG